MVRALVALKPFPYGKLTLKAGDAFEALTQSDYILLTRVGFARSPDAQDPPQRPAPVVEHIGTPHVVAVVGDTAAPMTTKRGPGRPRKYARKDLEAE